MSEQAKRALVSATSNAQGALVTGGTAGGLQELIEAKLVGPGFCLTRKGSIVRERLVRAAEDAAFA